MANAPTAPQRCRFRTTPRSEVGARMKSLEETLFELEHSNSSQSTSGMMPLTVPFEVDFGAF